MDEMTRHEYPVGIDCVWVASDRDGHVAAFVTAGVGPIPALVLNTIEPPLVEDIETAILKLPKVSVCRLLASIPQPDSFVAIAERGFFVYDWTDVHRTTVSSIDAYELMAYPVSPVLIDELPETLGSRAASLKYSTGAFNNDERFNVKQHFECLTALQ